MNADRNRSEFSVETLGLTKRYGNGPAAVDDLALQVRRGEVYGFVGPNGAGKTTTLRMLVGLIRPSSGSVSVLGRSPGAPRALAGVGAMIEEPAFYPFLSGRENLLVLARHAAVRIGRIDEVLEQVDLRARAGDRYSAYSLGMKQRLGLAAALLKDPELLVLDEPTNGLDPAGIAEMRDLLRSLGQGNRTVLLSSHLMAEVEQICDRVGVISRGRLVAEGTVEELRGRPELRLRASPSKRALELIAALPNVQAVESGDGVLVVTAPSASAGEINRHLVSGGVEVSELITAAPHLEEVFLELIAGESTR